MTKTKALEQLFNTSTYINIHYTESPLGWNNLILNGIASEGDIIIDGSCYPYGALHTLGNTFYFFNPTQYAIDLSNDYFDNKYVQYLSESDAASGYKNVNLELGYLQANMVFTNSLGHYNELDDDYTEDIDITTNGILVNSNTYFKDNLLFKNPRDKSNSAVYYGLYDTLAEMRTSINSKAEFSEVKEQFDIISQRLSTDEDYIQSIDNALKTTALGLSLLTKELISNYNKIDTSINTINSSISKINTEITNIKSNVLQTADNISVTESRLTNLINAQISTLLSKDTLLGSDIFTLQLQAANTTKALAEYQKQLATQLDTLTNNDSIFSKGIAAINSSLFAHNVSINTLDTSVNTLIKENNEQTADISKLKIITEAHNTAISGMGLQIIQLQTIKANTDDVRKLVEDTAQELKKYADGSICAYAESIYNKIDEVDNTKVDKSTYSFAAEILVNLNNVLTHQITDVSRGLRNTNEYIINLYDTSIKAYVDKNVSVLTNNTTGNALNTIIQNYYDSSLSTAIDEKIRPTNVSINDIYGKLELFELFKLEQDDYNEEILSGLKDLKEIKEDVNEIDTVITASLINLDNRYKAIKNVMEQDYVSYTYLTLNYNPGLTYDVSINILENTISQHNNTLLLIDSSIIHIDNSATTSYSKLNDKIEQLDSSILTIEDFANWNPIEFVTNNEYESLRSSGQLRKGKLYVITDA